MINKEYTEKLERVIKQMLTPLKDIPFNLVIEALTGCKVVPFDSSNNEDKELLEVLKQAIIEAGKEINKQGIISKRPNEVGNYIEEFVRDGLNKFGLKADVPAGKSGRKKSAGYPDLLIYHKNKPYYVECKTYNIDNIATTQRSFYFSPSDDFKVTYDTHHFVFSYEIYIDSTTGKYKCCHWRIISLENLSVDIKNEFNSDNKRLYSTDGGAKLLAEGKI